VVIVDGSYKSLSALLLAVGRPLKYLVQCDPLGLLPLLFVLL